MELMAGVIHKKLFAVFLGAVFFVVLSGSVFAAGLVPCGGAGEDPCTLCHFFVMFENIVNFVLFTLVPPLAILMLVIGGAMFFLAVEEPGKLNQAKSILTSVVIGLALVYGAWLIVNLFFTTIGINEADFPGLPQNWFRIQCG